MSEPLWKDEFSVQLADERYVTRRQFTKFLTLTSLGMFAGNLWILGKALTRPKAIVFPALPVARATEMAIGGVKQFRYPTEGDSCILIRLDEQTFVAYSQKCTHLSCAVYYSKESGEIECPCHEGHFAARDGRVLQGPPPRPLPRILIERRGDELFATGVAIGGEA